MPRAFYVVVGVECVRTVKIPVHYLTTKRKLSVLDRLTARLTYAVRLFCDEIGKSGHIPRTRKDVRRHSRHVRERTGLSSGFIQQAEDKALWMWRCYQELHREWEATLSKAKRGTDWYGKLLKRRPSPPCRSKRSKPRKIPTRFDARTGEVQRASLALTGWVIHISTLRKGETMDVLLNPSEWHEKMLNRPLSAVLIDRGFRFRILHSGKGERLRELDDRVSHLRRLAKWTALKRLSHNAETSPNITTGCWQRSSRRSPRAIVPS